MLSSQYFYSIIWLFPKKLLVNNLGMDDSLSSLDTW